MWGLVGRQRRERVEITWRIQQCCVDYNKCSISEFSLKCTLAFTINLIGTF